MNNFQFYSPTEFIFGKETENECGKYVKKHGGTKVLIHYGSGSVVRSGLLDRVKKSLDSENIPYVELGGVQPNPRDTKIYEGIEISRKENVDFILSVGGGSCIDSSKGIALGVPYDGDFWDFYGTGKPVEKALPIGTILTIAAAGSEGSGASVVTKEEGRVVLEIILYEGRNRQIRKMCEEVGLEVARLKRTAIGSIKLGMLKQGAWRELTDDEVRKLMIAAGLERKKK